VVNVDDDLVAMMSGGDLDGDTKMMETTSVLFPRFASGCNNLFFKTRPQ